MNEINRFIEVWSNMKVGQAMEFLNCWPGALVTSFKSYVKRNNMDWECAVTTIEKSTVPGKPPKRVVLTRLDPDLPRQLQVRSVPPEFRRIHDINLQSHVFHSHRRAAWAKEQLRPSRGGWELMEIGDVKHTPMRLPVLKMSILKACRVRNLLWRFTIRRILNPYGMLSPDDTREWHRVDRVPLKGEISLIWEGKGGSADLDPLIDR